MSTETGTKFSAVIFDMDGVLIDSEMHWEATERAFYASRGLPYDTTVKQQMMGKSLPEYARTLKERYGLPEPVHEIESMRRTATDAIYHHLSLVMPGVDTLLEKIRRARLRTAIASGSSLYRIEKIVDRFGWRNAFDILASTDHVNFVGKPFPDVYTYTVRELGLAPEECVAIEDSVNGVRSAKAAGIPCIAALDSRWSYGDYSEADLIVETLSDPRLGAFIGLPI